MRVLARAFAVALPLAIIAACSMQPPNGEYCEPGDYQSFVQTDGGPGFLKCLPNGSAYVLYSGPDPNFVPDASLPEGGDAAALCTMVDGKIPYMCFGCVTASDCVSGLVCEPFTNKGGYLCTLPCKSLSDCPANPNSAGCGNSGYCKPVT
jgi:hypothetical protein